VALVSAQLQADRSIHLAIALCAIVLPVVLGILSFATTPATDAAGRSIESMVIGSHLVTVGDSRHSDDDCGHDHESAECSPCSSCSAGLPSMTGPTPVVMIISRVLILDSHYDDVVPEGIRRPPRHS